MQQFSPAAMFPCFISSSHSVTNIVQFSFIEPMYHMIVEEYGIFMGYVGYMGGTQPGQYCTHTAKTFGGGNNLNILSSDPLALALAANQTDPPTSSLVFYCFPADIVSTSHEQEDFV